jgi:hypothetical protein
MSLTEHRKGGSDRTYKAGEVITESTDVAPWAEKLVRAGCPHQATYSDVPNCWLNALYS